MTERLTAVRQRKKSPGNSINFGLDGAISMLGSLMIVTLAIGAFPTISLASDRKCPSAFPEPSASAVSAREIFTPHEGEIVMTGPFDKTVFAANTVFLLGQGQGGGGHVYRLISKETTLRKTIKVYSNPDSLVRDLDAFQIFETLPTIANLRIARHGKIDPRKLEVENVEGRTVKSIKRDSALSADFREHISHTYEDVSSALREVIEKQYGSRDHFELYIGRTLWSASFQDAHGHPRKISFKPDNVVVDANTLELVLIDPF